MTTTTLGSPDTQISSDPKPEILVAEQSDMTSDNNKILRSFDGQNMKDSQVSKNNMFKKWLVPIILIILVIILGVASGFGLIMATGGTQDLALSAVDKKVQIKTNEGGEVKKGVSEGLSDITNKDIADGIVKKGGIDGEGSHHLVRPGGETQTLYMTSSIIDLDKYIDKKVKVAGDTLGAQHAGWLMDVVHIEVL